MIYTSYFANLRNLPSNVVPISICARAPDWYKGLQYKKLAPKYKFFMEWKKNHDNDFYIEHFNKEVLDTLIPIEVLFDIWDKLPEDMKDKLSSDDYFWYNNPYYHIALICYEKPEEFCHRHLVSKWLNENTNDALKKIVEWKELLRNEN